MKGIQDLGLPRWCNGKESACQCKKCGFDPWVGQFPWRMKMAAHSSILAWKIPWTNEPGGLQSMGSWRVRHDWVKHTYTRFGGSNFLWKGILLLKKFFGVPASRLCNSHQYLTHHIKASSNFKKKTPKQSVGVHTSICIFRCILKFERRVRKIARESSKTSGTEETPFLDNATQRYCLIAVMNISWVLKTGPAFCNTDRRSCRETTLERSSWDLAEETENKGSAER